MKKHLIAYVDEKKSEIRNFQRKFEDYLEVIGLLPEKDLDELVYKIFKSGAKALVADFKLSEYREDVKYEVTYNGVQLVNAILARRKGFPCFVLTSYDEDAIPKVNDVNLVYAKDALSSEKKVGNITFQERVRIQIEHYLASLASAERKFAELINIRKVRELTRIEEDQLIELDSFLEASLDQASAISDGLKSPTNLERLELLIRRTDVLIATIGKH